MAKFPRSRETAEMVEMLRSLDNALLDVKSRAGGVMIYKYDVIITPIQTQ